ncbi:MAG TPA: zf-HC2 domain-containing protein [Polyangiaceae bacterium]|nr:zf-HC2 domain-containing protein [Polyangiaceae bacterium]
MSCEEIQPELVRYHFGVIDDGPRGEVEEHLVGCSDCLRSYLYLKRDVETAEGGPQPSSAVLDRLRASVVRELALGVSRRWSWWERPLAFGFSGVLMVVAVLVVGVLARGPGDPPHGLIDPPVPAGSAAR